MTGSNSINIKIPDMKRTYPFTNSVGLTAKNIKESIVEHEELGSSLDPKISEDILELYDKNGRKLKDNETLTAQGINNGDTLYLKLI